MNRSMPSSQDSEQVILGSVILDNSVLPQIIGKLFPEDMYLSFHKQVFTAMLALFNASKPIDPITIGKELKKQDVSTESIGGITTITNLTFGLPHFPNLDEYIDDVKKASIARSAIRLCSNTANVILAQDEDLDTVLDDHDRSLYELRNQDERKDFSSVGHLAYASAARTKESAESGQTVTLGMPSGFKDLDEMTSGYQKTDLIIKAARPSMGKTANVLQVALNATAYDPVSVIAFFSLEMSKEQLINRLICQEARVDAHRYKRAHLIAMDWDRIKSAVDTLQQRHIEIDDSPRLSVMEIKARARKLRAEKKRLDMIIVDHGGLVKGSGRNERRLELGEISKGFKAMAKEFDIPIILLFQLSRGPEKRPDHRPIMSDLRESGEIEEDADVVELLYRDDYYKETEENKGLAEIIVAKNRNGPTGLAKLAFIKQYMRFEDLYGQG